MVVLRRHIGLRVLGGWRAVAARLMVLVLTVTIVTPAIGLARDVAFHQGHAQSVEAAAPSADADTTAPDPGLVQHVHCGCHLAAAIASAGDVRVGAVSRPTYARMSAAVATAESDRLLRPPRA
jgi:hypothetical protein